VIDCQLPTRHLESLGSRAIARSQFQSLLREHIEVAPRPLIY
jgi:Leu/Phe-tRNA-protein transferase